jgi:hypothetical protein
VFWEVVGLGWPNYAVVDTDRCEIFDDDYQSQIMRVTPDPPKFQE